MKENINITLKFFSGLDKDLNLSDYKADVGIQVSVKQGTRLRIVLKNIGLTKISEKAYFCAGERTNAWRKLKDGDEISCLRIAGGG